ncbi:S8 family peptidase [Pseudoalteromonas sp. PS5]|uniref:S8 family peptidase n=1 Tax=Pseudoalteromonas sp. PS5 TaxID=1437473 RepID=UPI000FFE83F6|nr:S8 family peptidase [Pseudoalteromonas sp. PS5]RXF01206.1 S8 family peptidase [Pseudoalteromonas sp. PS5]
MRKLSAISFAILAGMTSVNAQAAKLVSVSAEKAIENQYIVVFSTPSVLDVNDSKAVAAFAKKQANELQNKHNVSITREFGGILNGVVINASAKQLKGLIQNPNIDYIEQDQTVTVTPSISANGDQANPTWGLDRVDQRNLPLNSNYHYDFDGTGVTAYVIDTGVRISHNDFGNRATHGYDFVDNDNDATDCNGHGTHVAGTIGGGEYGVAKNVNIVGVRVLGCNGSGSYSGVIAGIDWVKNNASGPSVANMSLGGGASQAVDDAVNNAVAAGVSFVVAAGNDNSNACNYSPARAANAITVGSTTSSDARSSFSNYGNCLDIYAPGSSIKSAWYNSDSATNTISGTSMAAPHVAGAIALYLDENPSLSPSQVDSLLSQRASKGKVSNPQSGSPNELLYTLAGSTDPDPDPDPDPVPKLENGQAVTASGSTNQELLYTIDVPANVTLNVSISGGSGDADLYVRKGAEPTTGVFDCRPYRYGNNESCTSNSGQGGTYYIKLRGYTSFSGVSLVASY